MHKVHEFKLSLTSCEHKLSVQPITLYSYDINNNVMIIDVVDEKNEFFNLSEYKVEILSVFDKSKKSWTYYPQVEDDKIIFKFDTALIDKNEPVRSYVYISKVYDDGSIEATDVAVFEFRVRVSHKDLNIEEKKPREKKPEYIHNQTFTSDSWHINHGLGKFPQVSILDSSNRQVYGEVQHLNNNELKITFSAPFQGTAQLD